MWYVGIDPGKSGGIAFIEYDMQAAPASAIKMPATERDTWDALAGWGASTTRARIEKVGAMRGPDGRKQGVSSAFKFGQNYGFLRGCLVASGIPFDEVTPGKWQSEFGLVFPKAMNLTSTEKKNRHKAKAQQLFPHLAITHAIADALLIAEYARRTDVTARDHKVLEAAEAAGAAKGGE